MRPRRGADTVPTSTDDSEDVVDAIGSDGVVLSEGGMRSLRDDC